MHCRNPSIHFKLAAWSHTVRDVMPDALTHPSALLTLTRAMAQGEDGAWQKFHETYGVTLFRILLCTTKGDSHLASEALQHAYMRIAKHIRPCENEAMWQSWLRVVARSAFHDCRRRDFRLRDLLRRREAEIDIFDDLSAPGNQGALLSILDDQLQALDPDTRLLLEQKYFHGRSVKDLASALSLSTKAVESRLTRARAVLRERVRLQMDKHAAENELG